MKSLIFSAVILLTCQVAWAGLKASELNQKIQKTKAGWVAKDTWVSQLPADEARHMMGVNRPMGHEVEFSGPLTMHVKGALPEMLDWRNKDGRNWVSPMLNQANCGSCVAFATVGTLETQMRISSGFSNYNVKLSPQQLFSCGGGSCNWGWMPASAARFLQTQGVVDEACMPYTSGATGRDVACRSACADSAKRTVKIASYTTPTRSYDDVEAVKQALQKGPLVTTLSVYADFMNYSEGVYKHVTGSMMGGHAISIIGYDDTQRAFIIRNSWGEDWGQKGFGLVSYDDVSGVGDETWLFEPASSAGAVSIESPADYSYFTGHVDLKAFSSFSGTDSVRVTFFNDKSKAAWNGSCASADCAQGIDVAGLPDGRYEIEASAMDAQGNVLGTSSRHMFFVANQKPALSVSFTGKGVDLNSDLRGRIEFNVTTSTNTVPMSVLEFHFRGPDGKETVRTSSVIIPQMTLGWRTNLVPNGSYEVWMVGRVTTNNQDTFVETPHQTLRLKN